jgi:7-cyano-7-deazaguanine synthase in queuosine biosynthesis
MTASAFVQYRIRCDKAPISRAWRAEIWSDLDVITNAATGDATTLHARGLDDTLLAQLTPRSEDLYRIACAVFAADQEVRRGGSKDAHDDRWTRYFGLCIAVHDHAFWAQSSVQDALADLIYIATGDHWRFAFSPGRPDAIRPPQRSLGLPRTPLVEPPGCVVLFSGGIDSLAVLATAAARGERPLAVSQWGEEGIHQRQKHLLRRLRAEPAFQRRLQQWTFPHVPAEIHGTGLEPKERTRRSRAVLFAALGIIAAAELGIETVYFGDNGPISLNLPINAQIIGAHASRATHPFYLARVNTFAKLVYPTASMRISNPLWNKTRAETIGQLVDLGLTEMLRDTLSCTNWRHQPAATPHCGYCSQCLDRRTAMLACRLERDEPGDGYRYDAFASRLPTREGRVLAFSYVRFAQRIARMSPQDLVVQYPELLQAARHGDGPMDVVMQEYLALLSRHARMVLTAISRIREEVEPALLMGELPSDCVLVLLQGTPSTALDAPAMEAFADLDGPLDDELVVDLFADFYRDDEIWVIDFGGLRAHAPHQEGFARIRYLIALNGRPIDPVAFELATRPSTKLPDRPIRISQSKAAAQGLTHPIRIPRGITADQRKLAKAELHRLKDARNKAESIDASAETLERIAAEIAKHEAILEPSSELGRKDATERTEYDKAKDTVYQSIRRAMQSLQKLHPELYTHLKASLKYGEDNFYRTKLAITWRLNPPSKAA